MMSRAFGKPAPSALRGRITERNNSRTLNSLGPRAKKSLGQNFCVDPTLASSVVEMLQPKPGCEIWEIGPGTGALTATLIATGGKIKVFEIDERLKPLLEKKFGDRVEYHWGDVMGMNLSELAAGQSSILVCGNLPYYCATPIIRNLILSEADISAMVFLLQDEVARKIAAPPGNKDYGFLSVEVQLFAEAFLGPCFPPSSFNPQPKVNSSLVKIVPRKLEMPVVEANRKVLRYVSVLFRQRRKMALSVLKKAFPKISEAISSKFGQLSISPMERPENISVETFFELFKEA